MKTFEAHAKEGRINENASIRDRQSSIINAPIDRIWKILTDVEQWSTWNPEIKSVKCDEIKEGKYFECSIRGTHFNFQFQLIESPTLLTWTGRSKMVKVIYVWNLEASDDQTIVTVEESVDGFIVPIFTNHTKLHDILLFWLSALKNESEKDQ